MRPSDKQVQTMIDTVVAYARNIGKAVAVSVVDDAGYMVGLFRMEGANFFAAQVAEAKAFSSVATSLPTSLLEERTKGNPERYQAIGSIGRVKFIPGPGGFPIKVDGRVIGAIGVSGATAKEDEECAQAALGAL